ncbi:MAG: hypothetical protein H7270_00745 [Dermatophilaceae bacterium]|nr:hypothetical protein [Dermatophilaceae bacterium]
MITTHRPRVTRLALSLVMTAGVLAGGALVSTPFALASPGPDAHLDRLQSRLAKSGAAKTSALAAVAPTCVDASNNPATCPTISSVSVGYAWIRSSTTTAITYPITVVVNDPDNIAVEVDTLMGRHLDQTVPTVIVGESPSVTSSTTAPRKTFTMTVSSPYRAYLPSSDAETVPTYGGFQINPVVWGVDPADPAGAVPNQFLAESYRSGSIKARSVITNTPSATSVHRAQWFTERGRLTRFDGSPQNGQKVNVYYVPAGSTRPSYAGTATTSSTGYFSLPVRSWLTGSWFVNYPGSAFSTGVYKSVWIKVS